VTATVGKRIVIADDDSDIRALMTIAAKRAGVEVVAAVDNGRSALEAVQRGGIDLAVLDISMPGLNGIEVAQSIRSDPQNSGTRILMISASVQLLADGGVVADYSDSFMIKPFSPKALTVRIEEMLGSEVPA
jgi:DNA-binding response OmpR family regulator